MLRKRLPDETAAYPDPVIGVNLRDSLEDLKPGEAEQLANCYYDGGLRTRFGMSNLTLVSQGSFLGRGGGRVYPQTATPFRLVAFDTKIMTVSDAGVYGTVTNTMTSDQDTHVQTWSITDKTYVCNQSNVLCSIDSSQAFATVTGVNIPASPTMAVPFLDRLFAIQGGGVYTSNPRVDSVWSPNSSTWATYRPSGGSGPPTAIHLHSVTGNISPLSQLLIFQQNSLMALTGNDFGNDVTLASPPGTWDAQLTLLSPRLGTSSPYSICTVPGVGTFWVTQDLNVAWLNFNSPTPILIADKLFSNRSDISGLNNANRSQLKEIRMKYHDRKLKLFLPLSSNAFSTVQYWLDIRQLQAIPGLQDKAQVSWSGPHTGQSLSALWVEAESTDAEVLVACEGNTAVGMYVYKLNAANAFTDYSGLSTANVVSTYKSFYHNFGAPSYEKWIPLVRVDASGSLETSTVTLKDLHGNVTGGLSILKLDGSAFVTNRWGNGGTYGNGDKYGATVGQAIGQVVVESQSPTGQASVLGDAIQIQLMHTSGKLIVNNIIPQVKINRTQPVS